MILVSHFHNGLTADHKHKIIKRKIARCELTRTMSDAFGGASWWFRLGRSCGFVAPSGCCIHARVRMIYPGRKTVRVPLLALFMLRIGLPAVGTAGGGHPPPRRCISNTGCDATAMSP